jgi:hypothetical protein
MIECINEEGKKYDCINELMYEWRMEETWMYPKCMNLSMNEGRKKYECIDELMYEWRMEEIWMYPKCMNLSINEGG